jgi:hypothetical protein
MSGFQSAMCELPIKFEFSRKKPRGMGIYCEVTEALFASVPGMISSLARELWQR